MSIVTATTPEARPFTAELGIVFFVAGAWCATKATGSLTKRLELVLMSFTLGAVIAYFI